MDKKGGVMKSVILVGHKKRQGKDTFAQMLAEITSGEIIRFADPMKQIIADTFGITLEELENWKNNRKFLLHHDDTMQNYRDILQRFGTEAMKPVFGCNVWGKLACDRIDAIDNNVVIIPDFRFSVELEALNEYLTGADIVTVNVTRPGTDTDDTHASETELDGFDYDFTITNDGTLDQLYRDAALLCAEIELGAKDIA